MESERQSLQLHYRAAFDVVAHEGQKEPWGELLRIVRRWIERKAREDRGLIGRWFFTEGEWTSPDKRMHVCTAMGVADRHDKFPQYWALRLDEGDLETRFRRWRTDIGVEVLGGERFRFSVTTCHYLTHGYFGPQPEPPVPTTPTVVMSVLQSRRWDCFAGSQKLTPCETVLTPGDGATFEKMLKDPERSCPIVYASLDYKSGLPALDVRQLAKALAANAVVFVAGSRDLDKETEWFLPADYRCWNGMVRIYQPKLDTSKPSDSRRHRFLQCRELQEMSFDEVKRMFVWGLVRHARQWTQVRVASTDDIRSMARQERLLDLATARDSGPTKAQVSELEEFASQVLAENTSLKKQVGELEERVLVLEDKLDEEERNSARLEYEKEQILQRPAAPGPSVSCIGPYKVLSQLPTSLIEVVEAIEALHPDRIRFTERAKKTAAKADWISGGMLNHAWQCLWGMATTLHDIYFGGDSPANVEKAFKEATGYELSLTEGGETRRDKKLMRLRKEPFGEETIDIEPHVKYGKQKPNMLRVYYGTSAESGLIVVGHCGDHMENYSSRSIH